MRGVEERVNRRLVGVRLHRGVLNKSLQEVGDSFQTQT